VQGRLIVGLGAKNVLETGITLHHTYGTPVIPGSALKGLASHYCHSVWGSNDENKEFRAQGVEDVNDGKSFFRAGKHHQTIFGTTDDSGHMVFHDAWITPDSLEVPHCLALDVMTPHHKDYYTESEKPAAPSDFDDPNPVTFLSVTGTFLVGVSCDVSGQYAQEWTDRTLTLLTEALQYWGVGGKTSSGYGRLGTPSESGVATSVQPEKEDRPQSKFRYKRGDKVTVKCVENPADKKDRVWFEADDGVRGVVASGDIPEVAIGESASLWVQSTAGDVYNFSSEPPKTKASTRQAKGSRKKGRK
jgi:CRISPR-associated protein Cmr6